MRANAETPADARQAKEFGAEGIGLVRTEHMFFEGQRIVAMRQMILATDENDRRQALEKLLVMQRDDITELFKIMDGNPVTVPRLSYCTRICCMMLYQYRIISNPLPHNKIGSVPTKCRCRCDYVKICDVSLLRTNL